MKEKKLLRALGNVDNQYIKEAEPMKKTSKITNRQKWVSVAACFVLVAVIGVGVFQSNLFGTKNDIATLDGGETITFVKTKVMDDKQNVRKHLVFLLNYVLDNSKKKYLEADEMVLISNEVKNFKTFVSKANIDTTLKAKLDKINFDYSPTRANASSSLIVVILTIFTMGIYLLFLKLQELERKRMLVKFLDKYENLLKLF